MRIMAFDQATKITGWAMYDDKADAVTYGLLHCKPEKGEDITKRGRRMKRLIRAHLQEHNPDYVAFEGTFLGENVQTLIDLATFRGKCIGMADDLGFPVIDVEITDTMQYLHLRPGTKRKQKKDRAQFVATADLFGVPYASERKNPMLSEDEADAVVVLRIAQSKVHLAKLVAQNVNAAQPLEDYTSLI